MDGVSSALIAIGIIACSAIVIALMALVRTGDLAEDLEELKQRKYQ